MKTDVEANALRHAPKNILLSGVFSHAGDPGAWSGTPANLLHALEREGWSVDGTGYAAPRWLKGCFKVSSLMTGTGPDYMRTRMARRWFSWKLQTIAGKSRHKLVLHAGTLGIPLHTTPERHYIYLDSTYHLMSSQVPNYKFVSSFETLEKSALHRSEAIFTTSEYVRRDIIEHYGLPAERVVCARTGRGKIDPCGGEAKKGNRILFVGRGRFEEKGGTLLLKSFELAREKRPELCLTVVASEEQRDLVSRVRGTEFRTNLSWSELQLLFHTSDLYAMPALYEPWGLVYLEALASRSALLGLNRNALPEMTANGRFGILVDQPTPDAVAAGILRAFDNPERLARMGYEGQTHCLSTYSWENTARIIDRRLQMVERESN